MADQLRDLVNMVARREEQPAQAQEVRGSSINDKSARAVIEAGAITIRVPAENLPAIVERGVRRDAPSAKGDRSAGIR
jgi:hypothetical protein